MAKKEKINWDESKEAYDDNRRKYDFAENQKLSQIKEKISDFHEDAIAFIEYHAWIFYLSFFVIVAAIVLFNTIFWSKTVDGVKYKFDIGEWQCVACGVDKDAETITIQYSVGMKKIEGIKEGAFENKTNLKKVTIESNIHSIGAEAFKGCTGLTEIELLDIDHIGRDAFLNCDNLSVVKVFGIVFWTNIEFENEYSNPCYGSASVKFRDNTEVDECAFSGRVDLTSFVIPKGVTLIGNSAFYSCTELVEVVIPNTVIEIKDFSFSMCTGLTEIKFEGTKEEWENVQKESYWDYDTGDYTVICTDGIIEK